MTQFQHQMKQLGHQKAQFKCPNAQGKDQKTCDLKFFLITNGPDRWKDSPFQFPYTHDWELELRTTIDGPGPQTNVHLQSMVLVVGRALAEFLGFSGGGCRWPTMDPTYCPWLILWSMGGKLCWTCNFLKCQLAYFWIGVSYYLFPGNIFLTS